jgi:septum formation protein
VPLILASTSPRRRQLLTSAGYDFEVLGACVAELQSSHFGLWEITIANATRKALAVARSRPDATVLAADTLVAVQGEIIGKPSDHDNAREILRRLSGRTHEVCTAVFISAARRFACFTEISRVEFRPLSDRAINAYLKRINPLDKAGAYAAQEDRGELIASIEGSVSNVVGLPTEQTMQALARFDVLPRR